MASSKTYTELRDELHEVLDQLQDESIDIDKALDLHQKAGQLITELEKKLNKTKAKFEIIKKSK